MYIFLISFRLILHITNIKNDLPGGPAIPGRPAGPDSPLAPGIPITERQNKKKKKK